MATVYLHKIMQLQGIMRQIPGVKGQQLESSRLSQSDMHVVKSDLGQDLYGVLDQAWVQLYVGHSLAQQRSCLLWILSCKLIALCGGCKETAYCVSLLPAHHKPESISTQQTRAGQSRAGGAGQRQTAQDMA